MQKSENRKYICSFTNSPKFFYWESFIKKKKTLQKLKTYNLTEAQQKKKMGKITKL